MPVLFQKRYVREDAIRNRDVLYVFGDNLARVGMGGQAAEMRHESNAVGVATKASPTAYFGETPAKIAAQKRAIDKDMQVLFNHVVEGGIVIWPTDGIGTGLSKLPQYAPTTMEYVDKKLLALVRVARLHAKGRMRQALEEAEDHL